MKMIVWTKLAVLTLVLGSVMSDRVPVMLWSNDESVSFAATLAGHTIGSAAFENTYIKPNLGNNKNLIVFVQDRLSIADISHYANVYGFEDDQDEAFPNIKALMSKEVSANLPNVLSPLSVFDDEDIRVLEAPYSLESLLHSSDVSGSQALGVVLVKLPDVDPANRQNSLRANDKVIGEVVKQLEQHKLKYTALYTAVTSTKRSFTDRLEARSGRRLLHYTHSPSSNTSNHWPVGDEILLYLGGLSISNSSTSRKAASPLNLTHLEKGDESECYGTNETTGENSSDCFLVLRYNLQEPVENLTLKFSFNQSGSRDSGYWFINSFDISYSNGSEDLSVSLDVTPISLWSPMGFSMSCYQPDPIGPINKTHASVYIYMTQFQVQAFGHLRRGGFGYWNDCEYFFSSAIWMALISLAVMIGILVFGLYMLFQVTTMDRFDDPKGKTLIIAQAAD